MIRDLAGTNVPAASENPRGDEDLSAIAGTNAEGAEQGTPHVAHNRGDDEWYTPAPYIQAVHTVMGGIDLDPASSARANEVVGATRYYTRADDGLAQPWSGRVFLNPPYGRKLVDQFSDRLVQGYQEGTVTEAIVLVNNATETTWFREMGISRRRSAFPAGG